MQQYLLLRDHLAKWRLSRMLGDALPGLKNAILIRLNLMVLGGLLEMSRHIIHFIIKTPRAKYYYFHCTERRLRAQTYLNNVPKTTQLGNCRNGIKT